MDMQTGKAFEHLLKLILTEQFLHCRDGFFFFVSALYKSDRVISFIFLCLAGLNIQSHLVVTWLALHGAMCLKAAWADF